jgi:carboxymethylenebutenolidase
MDNPGMIAEVVALQGHGGNEIEAYYSRPLGPGPFPGIVVIHHVFGLDEWSIEVTRKLAHHGFAAIAPNLYSRDGPGSPDDQGARARAAGGIADAQAVGDLASAMAYLRAQPQATGKVGLIGFCSGGRHGYLAACQLTEVDALVDCWGGGVIVDDPSRLNEKRPIAPIELTPELACPVLGIFGNEDTSPNPDEVNRTEEVLKQLGKDYEFHRYEGVGHAFLWVDRPNYRARQATEAWGQIFPFLERHLMGSVPQVAAPADVPSVDRR